MKYTDYQGEKISRLGFGLMRLPVIDDDQSKIDYDKVEEGKKPNTCLTISKDKLKTDVTDFAEYAEDFKRGFDQLLADIFDPDKTFHQCEDDHHCKYCAFASYCQR